MHIFINAISKSLNGMHRSAHVTTYKCILRCCAKISVDTMNTIKIICTMDGIIGNKSIISYFKHAIR